jgi:hypothetical protein
MIDSMIKTLLVFTALLILGGIAPKSISSATDLEVVEVSLTSGVDSKTRDKYESIVYPAVSCENSNYIDNESLSTLYSRINSKVFLWTRIKSNKTVNLLHRWYKEEILSATRSSFFDSVKGILTLFRLVPPGTEWAELSQVKLLVNSSTSWKTWSNYDFLKNPSPEGMINCF